MGVAIVEGTAARLGCSLVTRQTTSPNPTPAKAVLLRALRLAFFVLVNAVGDKWRATWLAEKSKRSVR